MSQIGELFEEFSNVFPEESKGPYSSQRSSEILTKIIPLELRQLLSIDSEKYKIYGSVGTGNWVEIPWIAILDREITESTRSGYYICLLIDKEIKNIYMGLGVGWTQFEEEYGVREGKDRIQALCKHYAGLLSRHDSEFIAGAINLNAKNILGKGYEVGTILSRKAGLDEINDNFLQKTISDLLQYYQELKSMVGDSVLNLKVDIDKYSQNIQDFKKEVAKATFKEISDSTIEELIEKVENQPRELKEKLIKQIPRNRKFAEYIKQKNNYICELCGKKPFIQKNGRPYAEADHVIPLGGSFGGSDNPKNMRCLCAQCHAIVTHGSDEEIRTLLKK